MMEETLLPTEALPDERKHDQCVQLSYAVTGSGLLEQGTDLVKMCAFAAQSCVACCCLRWHGGALMLLPLMAHGSFMAWSFCEHALAVVLRLDFLGRPFFSMHVSS